MFIIKRMINVKFIKNEIAYVSFDSGKRSNLLSLGVIRQLTEVAYKLAKNNNLMAIILSGGKENFSFGFDLKDKEFLRLKKLAPVKAGMDNKNEILLESTLLKFKNLAAVIVIPARLTPGIKARIWKNPIIKIDLILRFEEIFLSIFL